MCAGGVELNIYLASACLSPKALLSPGLTEEEVARTTYMDSGAAGKVEFKLLECLTSLMYS